MPTSPSCRKRPVPACSILIAVTGTAAMQLEFHQLDRRWEHLRVRHPARQRRLLASLAESGQQTPIVVVAVEGQVDRYVVIDGHKRISALQQLGRDTVEGKGHRQILVPTREPSRPHIAAVPRHAPAKLAIRQEVQQLRENGSALVHAPLSPPPEPGFGSRCLSNRGKPNLPITLCTQWTCQLGRRR